jgi:hypothetical protein
MRKGAITVTGNAVPDLVSQSHSKRDSAGRAAQVFLRRVVMPVQASANSHELIRMPDDGLIDASNTTMLRVPVSTMLNDSAS